MNRGLLKIVDFSGVGYCVRLKSYTDTPDTLTESFSVFAKRAEWSTDSPDILSEQRTVFQRNDPSTDPYPTPVYEMKGGKGVPPSVPPGFHFR